MSVSDEFHTPHSSPMLNYFTPPEQREDYATTEDLELLEKSYADHANGLKRLKAQSKYKPINGRVNKTERDLDNEAKRNFDFLQRQAIKGSRDLLTHIAKERRYLLANHAQLMKLGERAHTARMDSSAKSGTLHGGRFAMARNRRNRTVRRYKTMI